jgi:hypothetical protein
LNEFEFGCCTDVDQDLRLRWRNSLYKGSVAVEETPKHGRSWSLTLVKVPATKTNASTLKLVCDWGEEYASNEWIVPKHKKGTLI